MVNCAQWLSSFLSLTIVFGNYTILVFYVAIFVPPPVDGVKAVSEGGVGRLQLVDLFFAVPDLRT